MYWFSNWIKSILQSKTKENILSITCGDIVLFHLLGVPPEWAAFGEKMLSTVILAALGGAAGWIGKELIIWVWKQLKKLLKKKK